jgi:hypothetical protein
VAIGAAMSLPPREPPGVVAPPDKTIILKPTISQVEKLIAEFQSLENDEHPEILRLKKEQDDLFRQQLSVLEQYKKHQRLLLERQCQCECQCADEELEDFLATEASPLSQSPL